MTMAIATTTPMTIPAMAPAPNPEDDDDGSAPFAVRHECAILESGISFPGFFFVAVLSGRLPPTRVITFELYSFAGAFPFVVLSSAQFRLVCSTSFSSRDDTGSRLYPHTHVISLVFYGYARGFFRVRSGGARLHFISSRGLVISFDCAGSADPEVVARSILTNDGGSSCFPAVVPHFSVDLSNHFPAAAVQLVPSSNFWNTVSALWLLAGAVLMNLLAGHTLVMAVQAGGTPSASALGFT